MKKLSVFFLGLMGSVSLSVSTAGAETYLSGSLGAVFLSDADYYDFVDRDTGEFTFDMGFGMVGAIGQTFEQGMRGEVELGYRSNGIDTIKSDGGGTWFYNGLADVSALSLMANGYYDFSPGAAFSPFIGVGVGLANVDGDGFGDDHVLAYQVMFGGSWALGNRLSLDLQYRYFGTTDPELALIEIEYSSHQFLVGLRQSF